MGEAIPTAHLDLLLLTILSAGPRHGYAVIEELRARSDGAFDLPEGTVYPALHRLERSGDIAGTWTVVAGRRRKIYRLATQGAGSLAAKLAAWKSLTQAVSRTIGEEPWPSMV